MGFNSAFKGLNQREVEFWRCITKYKSKIMPSEKGYEFVSTESSNYVI